MKTDPSSRRVLCAAKLAILILTTLVAVAVVGAEIESPPAETGETDDPRSALMEALEGGDRALAARLLEAGADSSWALVDATRRGDRDALQWLFDRGVVASGNVGIRALLSAHRSRDAELIALLRANGADLDAADPSGRTTLMLLAADRTRKEIRFLSALIEAGADINRSSLGGRTPLMFAVKADRRKVIRILLAAGAEIDARDQDGWTPLMLAARNGRTRTVVELLEAGADPNARSAVGWTPLMWAAWYGHLAVARELLAAGADPNQSSYVGGTPLIRAVQKGRRNLVALLIAAGARTDAELAGVSAERWARLDGRLYKLRALRLGAPR